MISNPNSQLDDIQLIPLNASVPTLSVANNLIYLKDGYLYVSSPKAQTSNLWIQNIKGETLYQTDIALKEGLNQIPIMQK